MKIYLAAPLFSHGEIQYNLSLGKYLESLGFNLVLPQLSCKDMDENEIYDCCLNLLKGCHALLAVMDGPQVDDGTAFECGFARALDIPVIGLRTDFRRVGEYEGDINLMLNFSCEKLCRDLEEVVIELKKIKGD